MIYILHFILNKKGTPMTRPFLNPKHSNSYLKHSLLAFQAYNIIVQLLVGWI